MYKSDIYKVFSNSDISLFIQRISSDNTLFEFFYIQANEEIHKLNAKIKI